MSSPAHYRSPVDGFEATPGDDDLAQAAFWSMSGAGPSPADARPRGKPLALSADEIRALQGAGMILTAAGRGSYHVTVPNTVAPPATAARARAMSQAVGRRA
jgi:hypothetical protein